MYTLWYTWSCHTPPISCNKKDELDESGDVKLIMDIALKLFRMITVYGSDCHKFYH